MVKRPRGPRSVVPAPAIDLETRALMYYLNHHLYAPAELQRLLGSVQDSVCQWANVTKYSAINLAISSMALAVFSRTQQHPPAAVEAWGKYDQLLRTTRVAMPDLVHRDIDAALLTIFLMSRYEDTMQTHHEGMSSTDFRSYVHHDGAAAILKIWRERCLGKSESATDIIKQSRRGIIRSHLLRHLALPAWLADGALYGEYGLELEYDRLVVGVASLRHQFKSLQKEISSQNDLTIDLSSWAQDISAEAATLSKALRDWSTRIPSTWHPQRHLIPAHHPLPSKHFYSSIVYIYPSIAYAAIWLHYYATSMLLSRTRLRILELVRPMSDDFSNQQQMLEEECCATIRDMACALSSSIPFALDKITVTESAKLPDRLDITPNFEKEVKPYLANLVAWPLSLASSVGGLDSEQRNWFRSELVCVGEAVGAGVLVLTHACDWLDL
ncbi:hypothetical protein H2200_009441 [Cladophialophora chaetospira]|uniref:Uncharacterized protein n=1 Tax=Cladophialophora chaetospira TaxID=386627 RepID=A0AA38X486_9EURO|nr:hypothetical protein H2200_009441 [Cladophialophora chaetospira]